MAKLILYTMKKYIVAICCLSTTFFFGQEKRSNKDKIAELYGDQLSYFQSFDPARIESLNDLLTNRVEFKTIPDNVNKKFLKLSEIPLFNKYNSDLKRDSEFDPNNFNILKYQINFYSTKTQIIRVDNTDMVIIIKPQNKRNHE